MPLQVDREHNFQQGVSVSNSASTRSLGRIVSGMKVATSQSDSVGLDRFMRDVSALFIQDQVQNLGAESSVR